MWDEFANRLYSGMGVGGGLGCLGLFESQKECTVIQQTLVGKKVGGFGVSKKFGGFFGLELHF